jgi:carbon monoxide dehydrogenase subunit G
MQLAQSFEVDAPLETVWKALIDVEHVAPCLPGAAVTGRNEDGSYTGTFAVKIGPASASYNGHLEFTSIDEATHTATMHAHGSDKRGQGGADAMITSKLTTTPGGSTLVEVDTDYRITGRLARFGRSGMIEDVSEKLLRQFADSLRASLVAPAPADGGGGGADGHAAGDGAAPGGAAGAAPDGSADRAPGGAAGAAAGGPGGTAAGPPPHTPPAPADVSGMVLSAVLSRTARYRAPIAGAIAVVALVLLARRRRGRSDR